MTLEEYINQTDPKKNVVVELDRSEVHFGASITIPGLGKYTSIYIIDGCAKLLWGTMYILKDGDKSLWVTDADGNPKNRSCFIMK